jgi:hypothetical protein
MTEQEPNSTRYACTRFPVARIEWATVYLPVECDGPTCVLDRPAHDLSPKARSGVSRYRGLIGNSFSRSDRKTGEHT